MKYSITVTTPDKLTPGEQVEAMESVHHIKKRYLKRYFPTAKLVCLLRCDCCDGVIGVGAIKARHDSRAIRLAEQAQNPFSSDWCELGYVTMHHKWRGKGLSKVVVNSLVAKYEGGLYATTSHPRMKVTLAEAGFYVAGNEWQGEADQILSLWIR